MTESRVFDTGATRDTDDGKLDYDGFLSPLAVDAFASYMHFNRKMKDGSLRDSDNWQKGIPISVCVKSAWRHFMDVWRWNRGLPTKEGIGVAICAVIFNLQCILHTLMLENPDRMRLDLDREQQKRHPVIKALPDRTITVQEAVGTVIAPKWMVKPAVPVHAVGDFLPEEPMPEWWRDPQGHEE